MGPRATVGRLEGYMGIGELIIGGATWLIAFGYQAWTGLEAK